MRVLAIAKRQYMGRDLIDDRFGRFREIPLALARRGHEVRGLCLSYEARGDGVVGDADPRGGSVLWQSVDLRPSKLGLARFLRSGRRLISEFAPDVVWCGSDSIYGPLSQIMARESASRVVFDIYDDFDAFASRRIPGVRPAYLRTCRTAKGITTYTQAMSDVVVREYGRNGPIETIENGTDRAVFKPGDRLAARSSFGLPHNVRLLGLVGSLDGRLGVETVFRGFEEMADWEPEVHLVVAGWRSEGMRLPDASRVHDLGVVAYENMPKLISALDVGVVLPREGRPGIVGFPYRAYEILAAGVPVVAVNVGGIRGVLTSQPDGLFDPDDPSQFTAAIRARLEDGQVPDRPVPDWDDVAETLESFLISVLGS